MTSIEEDLEIYTKEELMDDLKSDIKSYSIFKYIYGSEALAAELLGIYGAYLNYDIKEYIEKGGPYTAVAALGVLYGLSLHLICEYKVDRTTEKLHKLINKMDID